MPDKSKVHNSVCTYYLAISKGGCDITVQLIRWKKTSIFQMGRPFKRPGCNFF